MPAFFDSIPFGFVIEMCTVRPEWLELIAISKLNPQSMNYLEM